MKGKTYTEAMARFYSHLLPDDVAIKARAYMNRLAGVFTEYLVSDTELKAVMRQCRETEFTGTSYMPLPDEGALIRIILDVQSRMTVERQKEPEVSKCEFSDVGNTMICSDGEVIVRDAYFYRSMMAMTDMLSNLYPIEWIEGAFDLMDDKHKQLYRNADLKGKLAVMTDHFNKLDLPPRVALTYDECSREREQLGQWKRYK